MNWEWFNSSLLEEYLELGSRLIAGIAVLLLIIWYGMKRLLDKEKELIQADKDRLYHKAQKVQQSMLMRAPAVKRPIVQQSFEKRGDSQIVQPSGHRKIFRLEQEDPIWQPSTPENSNPLDKLQRTNSSICSNIDSETYISVMSKPFTPPVLTNDFQAKSLKMVKTPSLIAQKSEQVCFGMNEIRKSQQQRIDKQRQQRVQEERKRKIQEDEQLAKARLDKERQEAAERLRKQQEEARKQKELQDNQIRLENQRKEAEAAKLKAEEEARVAKEKADRLAKEAEEIDARRKAEEAARKKAEEEKAAAVLQQQRVDQENAARRAGEAVHAAEQRLQRMRTCPEAQILDTYVNFASSIQEDSPIDTAINSIQDCRKNVRDIFVFTESILASFDRSDTRQENTFMVKLWDIIVMVLLRSARKEGVEEIPPTSPDAEIYKNNINTYVLVVNLMRLKGQERTWYYFVGKTLQLLDFIYKRNRPLQSVNELELVRNHYLNFRSDFERIYVSRLDQLTYFLFGLLAMDPNAAFSEIIERGGGRPSAELQSDMDSINRPWDYSTFWLLVSAVRKLPFAYFKPIVYNNIFSILYLQYRQALISRTTGSNPYCALYRELLAETQRFGQEVDHSPEMRMLQDTEDEGRFTGDEFYDRVEPLARRLYPAKRRLVETTDISKFIKDACPLYYFTPWEASFA